MDGRTSNLLATTLIFSLLLNLFVPLSSALEENSTPALDNDNGMPLDNWQFPPHENSPGENSPDLPENSLISHWSFDEGQGDVAYNAVTGQPDLSVPTDGPTWTTGRIGCALDFDGADDYIQCWPVWGELQQLSVALWVRAENFGEVPEDGGWTTSHSPLAKGWVGNVPGEFGLNIFDEGKNLAFTILTTGGRFDLIAENVNFGIDNWHHIAATYDGQRMALYVNGENVASRDASGTLPQTDIPLMIGRDGRCPRWWDGAIDEVRIYNHGLSPEKVLELYGAAAVPSSKVDTIGPYWQNQVPFTVTATASGQVEDVELWYHYSPDNSSWGDNMLFGVDNDGSDGWSWEFLPENDGYYEFYSIATGVEDNREQAPEEADARCGIDRQPPESEIWQATLEVIENSQFNLQAFAQDELSGIHKVFLWYRYSPDGKQWTEWELAVREVSIFDTMFEALLFEEVDGGYELRFIKEGDTIGLYEFYSIARDVAGNVENAPRDQAENIVPDAKWDAEVYKIAYIPVRYAQNWWMDPILGYIDISPQPERTVGELKDRAELVTEYYWQQSFGKAILLDEFVSDYWLSLDKTPSGFPAHGEWWEKWHDIWENAVALSGVNKDDYRAIVVIQPEVMTSFARGKEVMLDDREAFSIWAHELGHAVWGWGDYYGGNTRGDIHHWGIMGDTSISEWLGLVVKDINPPPPVMSYNKVEEDWLNYRDVLIQASWEDLRWYVGEVDLIETQKYGDRVFKYDTRYGSAENYIFEGRYPRDGVTLSDPWHGETYPLWTEEGVLLYKIERGTGRVYTIPAIESTTVWVPPFISITLPYYEYNRVSLKPGESYLDEEADVEFFVIRAGSPENPSYLQLNVYEYSSITNRTVFSLSNVQVTGLSYSSIESQESSSRFDVDLHVYTPDNRHVGPRYDNREYMFYDLEIENANTSRNILGGGPEWIAIPDNVDAYAIIDTTLARELIENHPEINPENVRITADIRVIRYDENGGRLESKSAAIEIDLDEPTLFTLPAVVDIEPDVLNLNSKGEWVTAYIELPENYGVEHVRGEPYELEVEIDDGLTARQQELVDNLVQEIDAALAAVDLELEAEDGIVEVELEGHLSERGQAPLDELIQEFKREGNEAEISIEKEIDWNNYRTTIDILSVGLENVPAVSDLQYGFVREPELDDRDGNGLPELMVKFDRSAVQSLLQPGDVRLTIRGKLVDLLPFEGSDTIKVR